jgi:hypothetical protein
MRFKFCREWRRRILPLSSGAKLKAKGQADEGHAAVIVH